MPKKSKNNKRILTLDDLYAFYLNQNKTCTFSSKKSGYKISVQVPAKFEVDNETDDDTLLFCNVKLMHSGENRNHSCVTDEALHKAGKSLAYKPILANFMEYTDESTGETLKDFTSHDMIINDDRTITYLEKQIGCFTADEPYYEVEEETGHNFLFGKCAIPREYTDACSIIERKNGTKVSAELEINEMKYNAKSKVLELTDVIIQGATCLGKDPDTLEDIGEGMLNARLDIADFSAKNNSVKFSKDEKIIELLEKLNNTLSDFNTYNSKKGGATQGMTKFEELLKKYNKTIEDITFDYKDLSDDELTAKFAELFEEGDGTGEAGADVGSGEGSGEIGSETPTDNPTSEETGEENNSGASVSNTDTSDTSSANTDDDEDSKKKKVENSVKYTYTVGSETKKFEVSLQDKIYAIQDLVNATYAEADNTYYGVTVYEDYVVMCDYWSGRYYKQSYTSENDNYSLTGDRVEVYAEFVTADEQSKLDEMRSNYAALKEFKETAEKNELHSQREEILSNEKYASLAENEEFKKLVKNMDSYSLADLEKEAKIIFADNVSVETFAQKTDKKTSVKVFANVTKSKKDNRYGNLFSK